MALFLLAAIVKAAFLLCVVLIVSISDSDNKDRRPWKG